MRYLVIIGDVVASKQLQERSSFQQQLEKLLSSTSRDAVNLASPYTITLGDEFQAVYRNAPSLFGDLLGIMTTIYPAKVRISLGLGGLTTRLNRRHALGMDGPAFHRAREVMTDLKQKSNLMRIASDGLENWTLVNQALNLISHEILSWEQNRLAVLTALLKGKDVPLIAKNLNISRVAVYKNIRAGMLGEIVATFREIGRMIESALHNP